MKTKILSVIFFLTTFLFFPSFPVHAAIPGCAQFGSHGECDSVNTALGPISTNVSSLVGDVLRIIIGFSGAVAVLLVIAAGYQLITSQGNPEKVKEARERLTSAIVGLLFIFFSVTILQIVGIDILHLPGIGR